MMYWKGKWIMAVAVLHTVFSLYYFSAPYQEVLNSGIINSVKTPEIGLAVWFFIFGIILFISGQLILAIEKINQPVPLAAGLGLLVLAVLGAVLMPVSGFWLIFPPVIGLLINNGKKLEAARA
tara:strand:- start:505 stop:873 length:369 start_codon:yes stop_codon:yes gene_type:complete